MYASIVYVLIFCCCMRCYLLGNSQSDCEPQKETFIQQLGFYSYMQSTWAFFGVIVGASFFVLFLSLVYDRNGNNHGDLLNYDQKYRLDTLGLNSVYQFFLGTSLCGWVIVLATIAIQFWLLFVFVKGSEVDLSDLKSDLVYTWKCTWDRTNCFSTKEITLEGWLAFVVIMAVHILPDVINGLMMIMLSGKHSHNHFICAIYFVGGKVLETITFFTVYVSLMYNNAIANSECLQTDHSTLICYSCGLFNGGTPHMVSSLSCSWYINICSFVQVTRRSL